MPRRFSGADNTSDFIAGLGANPPFSRVFVAKGRRRRQSYGAFLAPGA